MERWLFVYLLCPIIMLSISKILLEQIIILKAGKMWSNSSLNYSFPSKGDFSGKIDYHNLCLYSRPHNPTTIQTNIRLDNFGPNLIQIAHLSRKSFFGKIDCYYCIPTVFFHATTFKKNPQRTNNKTKTSIILAQTGYQLLLKKGIFWKSWPTLLWCSYCIPSCYVISKYPSQSRSWV